MVKNGAGARNIFSVVEQIHLAYMHIQVYGYFELKGIGSLHQVLPNPLTVSALKQLAGGNENETKKYMIGCN